MRLQRPWNPTIPFGIGLDSFCRFDRTRSFATEHNFVNFAETCVAQLLAKSRGTFEQLLPLGPEYGCFAPERRSVGAGEPTSDLLGCNVKDRLRSRRI